MVDAWELGVASRSGRRVTDPPTHSNTNTPPSTLSPKVTYDQAAPLVKATTGTWRGPGEA